MTIDFYITDFLLCNFMNKYMHKLDDGKYYYDGQQLTEPELHMNVQFDLSHEYEVFKVLEDCWGGWNSTPRASEMYKIAKRWDENYGLYLDKLGHDTLVFKAKRILTETEITELTADIKKICALLDVEGGFDGIEKCINDDKRLPLWWD